MEPFPSSSFLRFRFSFLRLVFTRLHVPPRRPLTGTSDTSGTRSQLSSENALGPNSAAVRRNSGVSISLGELSEHFRQVQRLAAVCVNCAVVPVNKLDAGAPASEEKIALQAAEALAWARLASSDFTSPLAHEERSTGSGGTLLVCSVLLVSAV